MSAMPSAASGGPELSAWTAGGPLSGSQRAACLKFRMFSPEHLLLRSWAGLPRAEYYMHGPQGQACWGFWALSLRDVITVSGNWEGSPPPPHHLIMSHYCWRPDCVSSCHLTSCSASSPGYLYPAAAVTYLLNTYYVQGTVVTWYWLCAKYGGNLTGLAATAKDRISFLDQISLRCVQGGLAAFWAAQSEFNNQDVDLGWPSSQKAEVRKMDWLHFRRSQKIWDWLWMLIDWSSDMGSWFQCGSEKPVSVL